jgi:hypothetical protein
MKYDVFASGVSVNHARVPDFYVFGVALPVVLMGAAWRRYDRRGRTTLIIPALSVILLLLVIQHDLRWILLGPDYSQRLYLTIELNAALAAVSALYTGVRRAWMALAASVLVAFTWLWVGAINSVV